MIISVKVKDYVVGEIIEFQLGTPMRHALRIVADRLEEYKATLRKVHYSIVREDNGLTIITITRDEEV